MSAKLTAKQEMFCREYLIDLNGTQAAIRAGYKENAARQSASENLSKPHIADFIAKLKHERIEEVRIDAAWVLRQAVKVHERCMQAEQAKDRDGAPIGDYKFEHAGANKALEIIGKHVDVRAFEGESSEDKETPALNVTFEVKEAVKEVKVTNAKTE